MPRYRDHFTDEEFVVVRSIIDYLSHQQDVFTSSDALGAVVTSGRLPRVDVGSVAAVLDDLVDLGELLALDHADGNGPMRFRAGGGQVRMP